MDKRDRQRLTMCSIACFVMLWLLHVIGWKWNCRKVLEKWLRCSCKLITLDSCSWLSDTLKQKSFSYDSSEMYNKEVLFQIRSNRSYTNRFSQAKPGDWHNYD